MPGLSAALAARRAGADVILMEKFGCFGGVITTVGMETIAWYRSDEILFYHYCEYTYVLDLLWYSQSDFI